MRRYIIPLVIVLLGGILAAIGGVWAEEPADPVVFLAQFQGDSAAAVSFTFDDGLSAHRQIAAPMLAEFGFRGTFYIIAGKARERKGDPVVQDPRLRYGEGALSWEEIRQIAAQGHDIGNHSFSHLMLTQVQDDAQLRHQVHDAADLIAEEVGQRPRTFACPYNELNPRVRREILRSHEAIRDRWTDWGGPQFTGETGRALIDAAITRREWLVPMVHGINGGFLPLNSEVLRENLEYLRQRQETVWVDTFARVWHYVGARKAARLKVTAKAKSEAEFVLDSPGDYPDVPLKVVILADDESIDNLQATRDGEALPARTEGSRILVDVLPGPGEVQVTWE